MTAAARQKPSKLLVLTIPFRKRLLLNLTRLAWRVGLTCPPGDSTVAWGSTLQCAPRKQRWAMQGTP